MPSPRQAARGASASADASHSLRRLACTECRRRKQKCNYGNPCNNCAARFPQPVCTYPAPRTAKKKGQTNATSASPEGLSDIKAALDAALSDGSYAHLHLDDVREAIVQVETPDNARWAQNLPQDLFARVAKYGRGTNGGSDPNQVREATTQLSKMVDGWCQPLKIEQMMRLARRFSAKEPSGKVNDGQFMSIFSALLCQPLGLGDYVADVPRWTIDTASLIRVAQETAPLPGPGTLVSDTTGYSSLPLKLSDLEKELVRTYLQVVSRFKIAIDGFPDPENPFMRHWLPFCLSEPLLLEIMLYTSACFLHEWGSMSYTSVLGFKDRVYRRMRDMLVHPDMQTSDAAILGVEQMIIDSWLWGGTKDLEAHISGLKTMVRLRGGIQKLGMQGFISKVIIMEDIALALTHEVEPFLLGQPGFDFEDRFMSPLQLKHNSPLLFDAPPFEDATLSLRLHPCTAQILEEIRVLLKSVLSLPDDATDDQIDGVKASASATGQRLSQMPADFPKMSEEDIVVELSEGDSPETIGAMRSDFGTEERPSPATSLETGSSGHDKDEDVERVAAGRPPKQKPQVDHVFRVVRLVASIYCRSIMNRQPTSKVCSTSEFLYLWTSIWQAAMPTWKDILGVFVWALVAIVPSCHDVPKARFVEVLLCTGLRSTAVDSWHVAIETAKAALRFQRWLRAGSSSADSPGRGLGGKALRMGDG